MFGSELISNVVLSCGVIVVFVNNISGSFLWELVMYGLSFTSSLFCLLPSGNITSNHIYRSRESGLLCCGLIPLICILSSPHSNYHSILCLFIIGTYIISLVPAIRETLRYREGQDVLFWSSYIGMLSFMLSVALWMVVLFNRVNFTLFLYMLSILVSQMLLLTYVPRIFQGCFTIGEMGVLCQAVALFLFHSLSLFLSLQIFPSIRVSSPSSEYSQMIIFSYIIVTYCGVLLLSLSFTRGLDDVSRRFYILLSLFFIIYVVPMSVSWLKVNPVVWLAVYVLRYKYNILLVMYWIICLVVIISISIYTINNHHNNNIKHKHPINNFRNDDEAKIGDDDDYDDDGDGDDDDDDVGNDSSVGLRVPKRRKKNMERLTRVRKLFHLLMVIIFLPGLYCNKELLCLASVCALVLFLIVEAIRILRIPPLSQPITRLYKGFIDNRDSGLVILTHIYLLIGCSGPLWISIGRPELPNLFSLAGIVSVGIGDTMASFVGSKYGKWKWKKDSKKTVEGTLASICSQLLFVYLLLRIEPPGGDQLVISNVKIVTSVVITSLIEAFTKQIDNLILPLFMYLLLLL